MKKIFPIYLASLLAIVAYHIYKFVSDNGTALWKIKQLVKYYFRWDNSIAIDMLLLLASCGLLFVGEIRAKKVQVGITGLVILVLCARMVVVVLTWHERFF